MGWAAALAVAASAARGQAAGPVPADAVVAIRFGPANGPSGPTATRPTTGPVSRSSLAALAGRWGLPPDALDRDAAAYVPDGPTAAAADPPPVVLLVRVADYPAFLAGLHPVRTDAAGVGTFRGGAADAFVVRRGGYAAIARRPDLLPALDPARPVARRRLTLALSTGTLVVRLHGPAATTAPGEAVTNAALETAHRFLLAVNPEATPATAWAEVGQGLLSAGDASTAADQFRRAVRADPGRADLHVLLASALLAGHRPDEGAAELQAAVRIDPTNFDAFHLAGLELVQLGDYQRAVANLAIAVRLRPDSAAAHSDLAVPLILCGRDAEAEAELLRAIDLQPDYAPARVNLKVLRARAATRASAAAAGGPPLTRPPAGDTVGN